MSLGEGSRPLPSLVADQLAVCAERAPNRGAAGRCRAGAPSVPCVIRELLEISDLIVDYDPDTLEARPVRRDDVVARLADNGQRRAARYVAALPAAGGILDRAVCEAILLRAHVELQRLSEEFLQADRMRLLLVPLLGALRDMGERPPLRIVDVGCGLGYIVRALAAHGRLGRDVDLIGCDMNPALVHAAQRLAEEESLACDLRLANAFRLDEPAHVYISTGVVHHFRGPALDAFFAGQRGARAFLHSDTQPSPLSPLGAWLFHRARMREPLARHDGVVSARRAHPASTLLAAARAGTGFTAAPFDEARSFASVILRPMHAVVGTRPELWEAFSSRLGPLSARLGAPS
ncbi:MAG: class I SAM-dependent methyltransferase [Minicystis sp.]